MAVLGLLLLLTPLPDAPAPYTEALRHAKQGYVATTTASRDYEAFRKYEEERLKKTAKAVGVAAPLAAGLYAFRVYKDKELSIPLAKNHRLFIQMNQVKWSWNF